MLDPARRFFDDLDLTDPATHAYTRLSEVDEFLTKDDILERLAVRPEDIQTSVAPIYADKHRATAAARDKVLKWMTPHVCKNFLQT